MNGTRTVLALALAVFAAWPPTANSEPLPQYRYQDLSIPGASAEEPIRQQFSSEAARDYLDLGALLWSQQKQCVSCHTHGIYTAIRPALSPFWGEPDPSVRAFVVEQFEEIRKEDDRSGTSPTRMAYIARGLAAWDAEFHESTSPETDAALRYLFEMQDDDGSIRAKERWPPLISGTWHGTVTAVLAISLAPGWLEGLAEDDGLRENVGRLKQFLRETPPKSDHERLQLLWASTKMPDLLEEPSRKEIIERIWSHQRPDGGWSIRTFADAETWGGGVRAEKMMAQPIYADPPSDGYQTGLGIVVLRDAGIPADDPRIKRGVAWLLANQRESGRWWTPSLNADSRFHYITYSGSAYAALALAECGVIGERVSR